jgi:hypothetical protein
MAQFVIGQVRSGAMEKGVLRLYSDGKVPEGAIALSHGEEVTECVLFPILSEVINTKLNHKCIERVIDQAITCGADPVAHTTVENTSYDERDLIIGDDLLVNEEVFTAVFELVHDCRGDIASHEDRDFGWRALLN